MSWFPPFLTWSSNWSLGETFGRNRTNLKFLLLPNSGTTIWSLLLRAELGSETLGWQEKTVCWEQQGCGGGLTDVSSHCSWKGRGWQWEEGTDDPE